MTRRKDVQDPVTNLRGGHVTAKTCGNPRIHAMLFVKGIALLLIVVLALLGTDCRRVDAVDTQSRPQQTLYIRLLRSTALVITSSGSSGTAWVADRDRKLLITNFHVVAKTTGYGLHDAVDVFFPAYDDRNKVIPERDYYDHHVDSLTKGGFRVQARVVDADETLDLALLTVPSLPDHVTAVPLAEDSPSPGDRLHSIGNPGSSSSLWLYTEGAVKQVAHKTWASLAGDKLLRHQARVIETQGPVNPGDSGGPVVNDGGELVGVTQGRHTEAHLLNWAIEVTEVKRYLNDVEWMTRVHTAADYQRRARHYYHEGWYDIPLGSPDRHPTIPGFRDSADDDWTHGQTLPVRHNRPRLAIADLHEAIHRDPTNPDLYLERGKLWELFLKNDLALEDCNKAIALRPQHALAYACRAGVPGGLHDQASRLADLSKALELDRDCIRAYELLAYYCLDKDSALAINYLTEIVRRQPQNAGVLQERARVFEEINNYDAALKDLSKAMQLEPRNPRYYEARANLYRKLRRFREAAADRLKVANLCPENPINWNVLGKSLLDCGEPDAAIEAYTMALDCLRTYNLRSGFLLYDTVLAWGDLVVTKGDLGAARDGYRAAIRTIKAWSDPIGLIYYVPLLEKKLKNLPQR
jgi:tetratricopeptide (TPR) repeat protein